MGIKHIYEITCDLCQIVTTEFDNIGMAEINQWVIIGINNPCLGSKTIKKAICPHCKALIFDRSRG